MGATKHDVAPSLTHGDAAGAWSDARGQFELVGGTVGGVDSAALLVRRGGEWREVAPAGPWPPARSLHAMAYDPLRRRTIVMGGVTAGVEMTTCG